MIALDAGSQGGFNSDNFFLNRYNKFFKQILVDPIKKIKMKKINVTLIKDCGVQKNKKKYIF